MKFHAHLLVALSVFGAFVLPAKATTHVINTSPGLFVPSFRDLSNNDLNNTTWWGWSPGSFDQPVDNELVDNPPVTTGTGGLNGTLNQVSSNDILSSSNNIYTSTFNNEVLSFSIPTNGTVGTGFTTLILQGRTAFGGWNGTPGTFSDVGGVSPSVIFGNNSLGRGQFWAKYEIPGNLASYSVNLTMPTFTSIAELWVDTQWSSTSYAPDIAIIPEPNAIALIALGVGVLLWRKRVDRSARLS